MKRIKNLVAMALCLTLVLSLTGVSICQTACAATTKAVTPRNLTKKELAKVQTFINRNDSYGFLMSTYTKPANLSLDDLFYNGSGIGKDITDAEKTTLKWTSTEVELDCFKMTHSAIDNLLKKRTGLTLNQMNKPFTSACYLYETDTYYRCVGDTNRTTFKCISGRLNKYGNYVITSASKDATYYKKFVTVLKKTSTGYQFRSNKIYYADDAYLPTDSLGTTRKVTFLTSGSLSVPTKGWTTTATGTGDVKGLLLTANVNNKHAISIENYETLDAAKAAIIKSTGVASLELNIWMQVKGAKQTYNTWFNVGNTEYCEYIMETDHGFVVMQAKNPENFNSKLFDQLSNIVLTISFK